MDFYKCTSVSSPDKLEGYIVSGAGITDCNGTYTDTGTTIYGKPVYSYSGSGTTYYLAYHDGSGWSGYPFWYINTTTTFNDLSALYYVAYYADSPESGEWLTSGRGTESAPTVIIPGPATRPFCQTAFTASNRP